MDHDHDPSADAESDEAVGYGNPPKHTRWKPGECPNPRGRPKNAKGRLPILERVAHEACEVRVGSKITLMTRLEAVLMAVRNSTANGNPAAQRLFDKLLNEVREEGPPTVKGVFISAEKLTAEEWEAEYAYLGDRNRLRPPNRKRGLIPGDPSLVNDELRPK